MASTMLMQVMKLCDYRLGSKYKRTVLTDNFKLSPVNKHHIFRKLSVHTSELKHQQRIDLGDCAPEA